MPENKLTEHLEMVRAELSDVKAVDEKGRELLRALNTDIEALLQRSEEGDMDDSLLERLQTTIDHFEVTHPALTSALSNVLTSLSNAGI